jgi:hypothetical protein
VGMRADGGFTLTIRYRQADGTPFYLRQLIGPRRLRTGVETGVSSRPAPRATPAADRKRAADLIRTQTRDGAELVEFHLEVMRSKRRGMAFRQTSVDCGSRSIVITRIGPS